MLVTTPGLAEGISGVILCDETLRQHAGLGRTFPVALHALGMMAGVRVDTGRGPLAGTRGETVTEGLDGLLPRLRSYAELGAQFARWRAVLRIAPGMPSAVAVRANAQALGRYAAACHDAGLVAVVEPEVQMGGSSSLGHCETVTSMVLLEVMSELHDYGVDFEGVVLKPNMTLPGSESGEHPSPAEVAEATLGTLNGVPATLAGVAFCRQRAAPGAGHRAPGGHAAHPAPVAADVLVRPRAHRPGAGRLARRARPVGSGPAGPRPPGGDEHRGPVRPVSPGARTGPGIVMPLRR